MGATVWLGNPAPIEHKPRRGADGAVLVDERGLEVRDRVTVAGAEWTQVGPLPADLGLAELVLSISHPHGVWRNHSDAEKPSWVASDDQALADVLAHILGCPVQSIPGETRKGRRRAD